MVRIMTLIELARIPAIPCTTDHSENLPKTERMALLIFSENSISPATEAKESCSAALFADSGSINSMAARTKESVVGASFSRRKRQADRAMLCMKAARTAERGKPVTAAKNQIGTRHRSALFRLLPKISRTAPTRKLRCMPETATTCITPDRLMDATSATS